MPTGVGGRSHRVGTATAAVLYLRELPSEGSRLSQQGEFDEPASLW